MNRWRLRSPFRTGSRCPSRIRESGHDVVGALFTWSLLASAASLFPARLGASGAFPLALVALGCWLLATRSYRRDRRSAASSALLLLGLLGGFASYPAWIAAIALTGVAPGLAPVGAALPGAGGTTRWTATVLLAPVLEEVLYRERLLSALRPVLGTGLAVVATSVLFAVPHFEPWRMLGTLVVGLMLGAAMRASHSLALCIGLHMGLNLAGWACGLPPVRVALSPGPAVLAGSGGLAAAIALARATRRPPLPESAAEATEAAAA
ncbi:MAG: CPBP family intramembrane metalloprotease [Myxococcales bacterium]|nr:CPBP family intramembrane metalloprotease [Myxococcales bacterium]